MENKFASSLDFGTESADAVLVDTFTGETVATTVHSQANGVRDETLPGSDKALPLDWSLEKPADWLAVLENTGLRLLAESAVASGSAMVLGVDFTSCTVLPVAPDATPLCALDACQEPPDAWATPRKHHPAQRRADRIDELAAATGEPCLGRYRGKISSQWLLPKAFQMLEESLDVYAATHHIVEGGDWIVWQLSRRLAGNACAARSKAMWHKADGLPSLGFPTALHPDLTDLYPYELGRAVVAPGQRVGALTAYWEE